MTSLGCSRSEGSSCSCHFLASHLIHKRQQLASDPTTFPFPFSCSLWTYAPPCSFLHPPFPPLEASLRFAHSFLHPFSVELLKREARNLSLPFFASSAYLKLTFDLINLLKWLMPRLMPLFHFSWKPHIIRFFCFTFCINLFNFVLWHSALLFAE